MIVLRSSMGSKLAVGEWKTIGTTYLLRTYFLGTVTN